VCDISSTHESGGEQSPVQCRAPVRLVLCYYNRSLSIFLSERRPLYGSNSCSIIHVLSARSWTQIDRLSNKTRIATGLNSQLTIGSQAAPPREQASSDQTVSNSALADIHESLVVLAIALVLIPSPDGIAAPCMSPK